MTTTVYCVDRNGVNRCYGEGETLEEAKSQARLAATEYFASRPDIKTLTMRHGMRRVGFICNGEPIVEQLAR